MPEPAANPDAEDDRLRELVAECLGRIENEGTRGVESVCREHPQHAASIRKRLAALGEIGLLKAKVAQGGFPERLGDFRLLSRLGGGGMGVVFLAEQESVARRVALKLIRPEHLYFPGARERFQQEVDAIARLQHPGIIPLYAVGEDDGIPFLAMERVPGATLAEVVEHVRTRDPAELHGADLRAAIAAVCEAHADEPPRGASSTEAAVRLFGGNWVEACVRIARQVAEALDHAHARGVLHRDVKPSNIMVTADGRVLLLDFGLARSSGDERLTRTGNIVGSLPYLAPELLRRAADATEASDVWSLGVTLFELLTLRPPFAGEDSEDIRSAILGADPPPLRERNSTVSRDVETLCLTALEKDRARRYGSAAALATDLANVLELRPIEARRPTVWLRAWRFAQRHPAAAVGAAAALALAVLLPAAWIWQQRQANFEIQAALEKERAAHAAAERDFLRAKEAVDLIVDGLTQAGLDELPHMEGERRAMLDRALAFYEQFLAERGSDPDLVRDAAKTAERTGEIRSALGDYDGALRALDLGAALFSRLSEAELENRDLLIRRAALEFVRAGVFLTLARHGECQAALDRCVERLDHALLFEPSDLDLLNLRCAAESTRATVLDRLGSVDMAFAALERSIQGRERCLALVPDDYQSLRGLAITLTNRSELLRQVGRVEEAEAPLLRARSLYQRALQLTPGERAVLCEYATLLSTLGNLLAILDRFDEGEVEMRAALEMLEEAVRLYPGYSNPRRTLATTANTLAIALHEEERFDEAEELYGRALAALDRLVAEQPAVPSHRAERGATLTNFANLERDRGDLERARELLLRSIEDTTAAIEADPERVGWREFLYHANWSLALVELDRGALAAAAAAAEQMRQLAGGDGLAHRLIAGILARAGEVERGMAELTIALEAGFADFDNLEQAADLARLRLAPEFAALIARFQEPRR